MKRFKKTIIFGFLTLLGLNGAATDSQAGAMAASLLSFIPVGEIYDSIENYNRNNNHVADINDTMLFFEDNGCGMNAGNVVGSIPLDRHRITRAKEVHTFVNDEARSLLIANPESINVTYPAIAGSIIVLYDSPSDKLKTRVKGGYTVIRIHKDLSKMIPKGEGYCISSFERTDITKDGTVEKIYVPQKKGSKLDGKISTVVSMPGKAAKDYSREKWVETLPYDIIFYENNHCEGGHKGEFRSRKEENKDCKNSKTCHNDEIRSMRIFRWAKPGTKVYLYDNHKAEKKDDWAEIEIEQVTKENASEKDWGFEDASVCIPTFDPKDNDHYKNFKKTYEKSYSGIHLKTHYKNGLDGKISHVVIAP